MPSVSAVIVSWNTADLLAQCLQSLDDFAGQALEVVVVDNGSTDGSVEMLRTQHPGALLIVNERNEGFTRANNQGMAAAGGDVLLLINADARLTEGCLPRMLTCLEAELRAGAVGPRLVYGDGSWQRWTAGRAPSLRSTASYFLMAERFSRRAAAGSVYLATDEQAPFMPDWVSSACMLLRREALGEVGFMDESFFCYMDDVDICQRLRDGGWGVWYVPEAEAVHLMGQSTKRQTGSISSAALLNFNRYFERRHGRAAASALRGMEVAGFGVRWLASSLQLLARPDQPLSRERARVHWKHLKLSLEVARDKTS